MVVVVVVAVIVVVGWWVTYDDEQDVELLLRGRAVRGTGRRSLNHL